MTARRALSFVPLLFVLFACSDGDDGRRAPAGVGPVDGVVFVDEDALPGGDGSLDAPVATLAEAFALIDELLEGPARVVVLEGRYVAPSHALAIGEVSIEGAGPDQTRIVADDVVWGADGDMSLSGMTVEGSLAIDVQTLVASSVDLAVNGELDVTAAHTADLSGGAFAGPVHISGGQTTRVVDSAFEGGTLAVDGVIDTVLTGVVVRDSVGTGVRVADCAGEATLTGVQVFDIALAGADASSVDGVGVSVENCDASLDEVLVARTAFRGIDIRGGRVELTRTTIAGGGVGALAVQGGAVVDAEQLNVSDAATLVFSADSSTTLRDSTLRDGTSTCVLASSGGTFALIESTVLDCPMGHVSVLGDVDTTLRANVVQNAQQSACLSISANRATVRVEGNSISDCAGSGVGLLEVTETTLVDNDIRGIVPDPSFADVADGLTVVDADFVAQNNRIRDAAGTGVSMLRSAGLVAGNHLSDFGDAGVRMVDPRAGADPVQVVDNRIERATIAGVVAFSLDTVIEGNTIDDTVYSPDDGLGDGLLVGLGANVEIIDNIIRRAGSNGMLAIDGVAGRVAGNRFVGNGAYGVAELCTEPGQVVDLTYEDNVFDANVTGERLGCDPSP